MINTKLLIRSRKNSKPSSGEKVIIKFLKSNKLNYSREWYHDDLKNPKSGYHLFFDFYIPSLNMIIEVDGAQHYQPMNGKVDEFIDLQRRDELKNVFCLERGIRLIRLKYSDLKPPFDKLLRTIENCIIPDIDKKEQNKKPGRKFKTKKVRKLKGQHPEKCMNRLKTKIEEQSKALQKKRESARNMYPIGVKTKFDEI